jgi:hypothetical protein
MVRFAIMLKNIPRVIEEKRGIIKQQFNARLFGTSDTPAVIGKLDVSGGLLIPVSW